MYEKKELYAGIDELLQEFGLEPMLGGIALAAAQSETAQKDRDKDGIMAGKIRCFSAVLFPTLPRTVA